MPRATRKFSRYESLTITFTMTAAVLLGTVSYQYVPLEAMAIALPAQKSVDPAMTPNARDTLRIERGKRDAAKMAKKIVESRVKLSPRTLRTNTGGSIRTSAGVKDSASFRSVTYERSKCGDSIVVSPEKCDDGNSQAGDGCGNTCVIETGFQCTTSQPSYCWDECGDGKVSSWEKCDDGNGTLDDGCNTDCRLEPGYTCSGSPSKCTHS